MHLVALLFSFHGRANRAQYWLGGLGAGVAGGLAFFFLALIAAPGGEGKVDPSAQALKTLLLFAPVFIALAWASLALQVKRFHDRGRSGYWAIVPFVPGVMIMTALIGGVMSNAPATEVVPSILPWIGVSGLVNLWLFVDLGLLPGTQGGNKYGDPPGSAPASFSPNRPSGGAAPKAAPAMSLGGAESAMERAIAARGQTPQPQAQAQAAPSFAQARPATPYNPAAPGGFGRRPAT